MFFVDIEQKIYKTAIASRKNFLESGKLANPNIEWKLYKILNTVLGNILHWKSQSKQFVQPSTTQLTVFLQKCTLRSICLNCIRNKKKNKEET